MAQVESFKAPRQIPSHVRESPRGHWADAKLSAHHARHLAPGVALSHQSDGAIKPVGLGNYANDAAAAAGSVPVGGMYRNGSVLMVRVA